jgi:hypothetical protein
MSNSDFTGNCLIGNAKESDAKTICMPFGVFTVLPKGRTKIK